ncbi:MAG: hypothetical protein QM724_06020 [Flavobacteriales bacterium]
MNWDAALVSPEIDLHEHPYVQVTFQQRFRYCCQDAPQFLEVSTDGGATWPFSYSCAGNIGANVDNGTMTKEHQHRCGHRGQPELGDDPLLPRPRGRDLRLPLANR